MSIKEQKLKELVAKKKELVEQQKALKEELNQTKEVRQLMRKVQNDSRKDVRILKSQLAKLTASTHATLMNKDVHDIGNLAEEIMGKASELSAAIHNFREACGEPEDFQAEGKAASEEI